ncbi:glycerol-3-phosphate phosphatase-like [Mya arenaria]|uniref:glycerol-3-phosphate phosphatase-like n=1 Tax=Mya arenaria TaxID=6604 RepID=UPI0022E47507|nr:glycerol-3-phosphate phosphatase-like [Mya arenaria]XP_052807883.1 glycerol-3-phosphate phosphatase-like [Mya arenaria]
MMFSKGPASRLRRPLVEAARLLSGGRMQTESISCRSSIERFLDNYDTFLFDCDGVVWKNDHVTPIPGIPEAIEKLHQLGKTVIYVTNNSMVSRASLQKKFNQYGFDSSLTHIYGPGYCAALYLKDVLGIGGRTYLVGGTAMKWELDQLGVANCGVGADTDIPSSNVHHLLDHTFHDDIQAVLVGFDEHFSFNKIFKAASYISNPECHFLATNTVEQGLFIGEGRKDGPRRLPLTGVKVNAIAMAANRAPFVIGKPYRTMFDCVLQTHPDIDPSRTVFVGDNLKADMAFAKTIGVDSTLVLSGVHGYNDVKENSHLAPTYILGSLADIT